MKAYIKLLFRLFFMAFLFAFAACTDEIPEDPDVDPREKFTGFWSVKEESQGSIQNYGSTVTNDPGNTSRVLIGNIFNLNEPVAALVAGNSLTLENSTISGFEINGTGIYSGGSFILNYTSNDGSGARQVKATYTR
jgi:hypothetical protein